VTALSGWGSGPLADREEARERGAGFELSRTRAALASPSRDHHGALVVASRDRRAGAI